MLKYVVVHGTHHRKKWVGDNLVDITYRPGDIWEVDDGEFIDPITAKKLKILEEDEAGENDYTDGYKLNRVAIGWYDIIDISTNEVMNDKRLRLGAAEALMAKMVKELDNGAEIDRGTEEIEEEEEDTDKKEEKSSSTEEAERDKTTADTSTSAKGGTKGTKDEKDKKGSKSEIPKRKRRNLESS